MQKNASLYKYSMMKKHLIIETRASTYNHLWYSMQGSGLQCLLNGPYTDEVPEDEFRLAMLLAASYIKDSIERELNHGE